jgi:4-amino-4-deoxy-L-arabinose transferase-like glycosyltransferase
MNISMRSASLRDQTANATEFYNREKMNSKLKWELGLTEQTMRRAIRWAIALTLLANAAAMLTPVFDEGDSIVYAALSQHIAQSNDWINLVLDQKDWLDKPHFPFWVTALFFKIGGVSATSYILPGYFFHLLGGYFTYRIARWFFGRDTALLALLLYVSTFNLMYTASEIRAEAYLTGSITAACYFLLRLDGKFRWKHLILCALFMAISVMTKGIFTLITCLSGIIFLWIYQRRWGALWRPRWFLLAVATLLFIAPELVSLYLQFDSHPEKIVFNKTAVSGVRFFLWDSQFGRFFNFGPIRSGDGNPLYYVHVFGWAFLPWVAVFVAAAAQCLRGFDRFSNDDRAATVYLGTTFFVTFALFSAATFQGDYYTVILFPFAVVLCARYLCGWMAQVGDYRGLYVAQITTTVLIIILALTLTAYVNSPLISGVVLVLLFLFVILVFATRKQRKRYAVLIYPVFGVNMLYVFLVLMNAIAMTRYGVAYNVHRLISGAAAVPVYAYRMDDVVPLELSLYSAGPCHGIDKTSELPKTGEYLILVRDHNLPELGTISTTAKLVASGNWINHKTGILPRALRLAKGIEPLEPMRVLRVSSQ